MKIFGLIILALLFSCNQKDVIAPNESTDVSQFVKDSLQIEFEGKFDLYLKSSHGGWINNDNGRFAWDDAYVLDALTFMYALTEDYYYLNIFNEMTERIIAGSDWNRSLPEIYRGNKVFHGWSSTRYTLDNSRHIWGIHDAMILHPFVKMANRITNDDPQLHHNSLELVNYAKDEFDNLIIPDWVNLGGDVGYFTDPYLDSINAPMPLNMLSKMASFSYELYLATKEVKYLDYALATANFIKKQMIEDGNAYRWSYSISESDSASFDDINHSILVIEFVLMMYENGQVFDSNDIEKVINTFLQGYHAGENKFFRHYGGYLNPFEEDPHPFEDNPSLAYYFLLSPYSEEVKLILQRYLSEKIITYDTTSNFNHLGIHLILEFAIYTYVNLEY